LRSICLSISLLIAIHYNVAYGKLELEIIPSYDALCDDVFSCPESLTGRISFWVDVFSRWDTNTAIFHDKENPERVYSTLKRKQGCRYSKKGDAISRERKQLKKMMLKTAEKIQKKASLTRTQSKVAQLFVGKPISEMKAAANRIRCQSGNRDRMQTALTHFKQYQSTIIDALQKQNLSTEIQYLPFVESAFNPNALSHVGAAGMWQIMPSTGRKLGLTVDVAIDERYDPFRASYAAALYFRNSVDDLTNTAQKKGITVTDKALNPFVVTSYNYGVRGMERGINKVGLDYEKLLTDYKSPNFQTAVKNFYASFLGARYVAKNASNLFGQLDSKVTHGVTTHNTIALERATSAKRIMKTFGVSKEQLQQLNPAIRDRAWRDQALLNKGYELRLPFKDVGWSTEIAVMLALPKEQKKASFVWHKVRSGQTACGIAEKYRVSCRALKKLNRLNKKATIYVGKRIKVPTKGGSKKGNIYVSNTANTQFYKIRRGDTACQVAENHKMRCSQFLRLNGLSYKSILPIGKRVKVKAGRGNSSAWHTVAKGQTACGIAYRYKVSCGRLLAENQLKMSSKIQIGQRLRIPGRS